MCGIFALLNSENINENYYVCNSGELCSQEFVAEQFMKCQARGPENSNITRVCDGAIFGFHRLAINGLNSESNQPLVHNKITLICNGEIYNYKELYALMVSVVPSTDSDCEVILWLYEKYGIEQCLQMLDGVFAFVILDERSESPLIYAARDPYGVRPLYILDSKATNLIGFASELKSLCSFGAPVRQFAPGTYSQFTHKSKWTEVLANKVYHRMPFSKRGVSSSQQITSGIREHLTAAVVKRCQTTERPIACLLSGGLDSSLITALVCKYAKTRDLPPPETYSIGLSGSVDLKYAKMVAVHLGTKHTEIVLSENDFIKAIPRVIYAIESYDTTSVRASIGNYLLGEYISKHSEAKVIFNGDGSDELLGGYLYMNKAPDAIEFDRECRRLLADIHAFDVLRSDKSISSHGLEPRTPFLDRYFTQFYLSLPEIARFQPDRIEKFWLRQAFSSHEYGEVLLPHEVLWRRKEAFSDGVSGTERSLYQIIQDFCRESELNDYPMNMRGNLPKTLEQFYYRTIFEKYYEGYGEIVPYFWMPKYVVAKDASARTLDIY